MIPHTFITDPELRKRLRRKDLTFAGNKLLKIYGSMHCRSGKRMKKENRMFFTSEEEAVNAGYRPCGHCMKFAYQHWKKEHGPV
jgi:methylphosphotriester-DNA--protein-cysteine methyltransferase